MLRNLLEKVKQMLLPREDEIILAAAIVLVALIGFGLGRLSAVKEDKFPIQIQYPENQEGNVITSQINENEIPKIGESGKIYVGSKNSAVYHLPWCSGAQRIREENKIWFSSKEEAEKAGYRPAANCKGI